MNLNATSTRVALTGAAGYLGTTLSTVLARHFPLRTLDVQPVEGSWEKILGSVADLDMAMALCKGCSHLVIGHMAPRKPDAYASPTIPFDVNVKGAANLFHAAHLCGIRRVILISSTSTVSGPMYAGHFLERNLAESPIDMYSLTKALQENVARYYHEQNGLEVAVFRPAHICSEDDLVDKYGRPNETALWTMTDPRDIAEAVRLALLAPKLDYEIFYLFGHVDGDLHADIKHTRDFLGWRPRHTFEKYPRAVPA